MRVQITYSEELENIPSLIEQFLVQCGKELLLQADEAGSISGATIRDALRSDETLESIDVIRQEQATLDQRLADVSSLLSGYNNAIQGNVKDNEETTAE